MSRHSRWKLFGDDRVGRDVGVTTEVQDSTSVAFDFFEESTSEAAK